jgi:LuxR family maltose regulon positive regulatory protein
MVSAWAQSVERKGAAVCWLSLDGTDNNPGRFLEYLFMCLEEGGVVVETTLPSVQSWDLAQVESLLAALIRALMDLKRDIILVLDDYHLIDNPEVHSVLGYLLDYAPIHFHMVLLTRSDPPFALASLRVADQLNEIRMDQLRFSAAEAGAFFMASTGTKLSEEDVLTLNTRTEGWIAGLQLAAISLRGREDTKGFISAFAGSNRYVFDYLLEQVLNRQPPDQREFLLRTSVLERLCAPLCDAVAQVDQPANSLLNCIERANLFLVPLDEERIWYRYHHLFSDLLRIMLDQAYPGLVSDLHLRASRWYENVNMLPEALHHALAAEDMKLAARLVSTNVLALVEHAELTPILLKMDSTSIEQRASLPWLGVAHAWSLAYTGQIDRAEAVLVQSEEHMGELPQEEQPRLLGHIHAVRAYISWVEGNQQKAVELAMEAALYLPQEEYAVRSLNLTTLGNALVQYEPDAHAVDVLEKAVDLARRAKQSHVLMPAATALAYAYLVLGEFQKDYSICMEALEVAEAHQRRTGQMIPAAASAYAQLSIVLSEWGEIEKSSQAARKGLALSELWGQADTTMLCLLSLAESLSLAHDTAGSQKIFKLARKMAGSVSPWFVFVVDSSEANALLDAGEVTQAARLVSRMGEKTPASIKGRLLLKEVRLSEAIEVLDETLTGQLSFGTRESIRRDVILALACYLKKDDARALSVLKQILPVAEAENRISVFVRQGPVMEKLLRLGLTRNLHPVFIRKLLSAFEEQRQPARAPRLEELVEPLSEREIEVLRHLNGPLSTPEIADILVVSTNTVRTHIKNIYGKLGVHGRSGAVRRAKELALIA